MQQGEGAVGRDCSRVRVQGEGLQDIEGAGGGIAAGGGCRRRDGSRGRVQGEGLQQGEGSKMRCWAAAP